MVKYYIKLEFNNLWFNFQGTVLLLSNFNFTYASSNVNQAYCLCSLDNLILQFSVKTPNAYSVTIYASFPQVNSPVILITGIEK